MQVSRKLVLVQPSFSEVVAAFELFLLNEFKENYIVCGVGNEKDMHGPLSIEYQV